MVRRHRSRLLAMLPVAAIGVAVLASAAGGGIAQTVMTDDVAHDGGLQWGFDRIGAATAWTEGRGGGVVIAVVDSGVALEHEDLAGQLVGGTACHGTEGDPDACDGSPQDDDGHGTHVAGIAAAKAGNRAGIAGVAPDARVMPIKVLFEKPNCDSGKQNCMTGGPDDVAAAIRWAIANGADIINLSLGSTADDVFGPEFVTALEEAWDAGVIPVIAAGNEYVQTANFADAHAVVVGATTRGDGVPSYANGVGEARWTLAAPGGDEGDTTDSCAQGGNPVGILSTYWAAGDDGAYACLSGTSMAAPHVSGALAVLLSMPEYATARAAIERLVETTVDLGEPGRDDVFGSGLIDLAAATGAAAPTTTATTTTTSSSSSTTTTISTTTSAAGPTTEATTTTTTTSVPTSPPPPVTIDDIGDETAGPVVLDDDGRSVGRPLAVGAGVLALSVALSASALRRRGLV